MTKSIPIPFYLFLLFAPVAIFADDPFTLSGGGCIAGTSGSNCVRDWTIENGPGWTGHRASWSSNDDDAWRTRILCSSSCQRHGNNSNECMLISVMHGIYSHPGDMVWLMLGGLWDDTGAFSESVSDGGPFCISFHKAIDWAWQYNCAGEDAFHMAGFFEFILDEFPIDPNAIALHGFSSGAIMTNHLMTTGCPVEKFVSIGAPYGGGFVASPPTTKAAYIVAHGTHDNVVQYDETWDFNLNKVNLSCECNEPPGSGTCSFSTYLTLQGERLAGAVASLRGYTGDVWANNDPNRIIHSPIDLLNEDFNFCTSNYNECINPLVSPNPWNTNFDCSTLGIDETDVIEYPVTEGGKVQMLRMNLHNHDYPNKRRSVYYSPVEYFFYLKNFFASNKGPHGSWGQRSTTVEEGKVCNDPTPSPPDDIFKNTTYYIPYDPNSNIDFDSSDCEKWCLNEKRCIEAFYFDFGWGKWCKMHFDELCANVGFGAGTRILAATAPLLPTSSPTQHPTAEITPEPTKSPTGEPCTPLSLCPTCGQILDTALAGYACLDPDGISIGDDNFEYTEADCLNNGPGYVWVPYTCYDAEQALLYYDYSDELRDDLKEAWRPKCCNVSSLPTTSPVASPPSTPLACPEQCVVPDCFFAGKPGPAWWPPEWPGDPDGSPTEDGFCTKFCNEYDPISSPGKRICSNTLWDPNGINCESCTALVNAPPLPIEDRLPSSGLCSVIDDLSGHLLWGRSVRECNNGAEPTNDERCTVYQSFNGDDIINPERNCDGFCSHFGLSCINGYDDGDDGCVYGGQGIGCFDRFGVGSIGGPTPDHVCVCALPEVSISPTQTPTDKPSATPIQMLTDTPSAIPTKISTVLPSVNPSNIPSGSPTDYTTGKPSDIPTEIPTALPSVNPSTIPSGSPTEYPSGKPSSIPSLTPSKSPTVKPSRIPSVSPSIQPTPYCVDSPLQVVLDGVITTCPFATPSDCERESLASTCPYTCGACREWACKDAIGTVVSNGNYAKCDVLDGFPPKRVRKICERFPDIKKTCRGTCRFCEN